MGTSLPCILEPGKSRTDKTSTTEHHRYTELCGPQALQALREQNAGQTPCNNAKTARKELHENTWSMSCSEELICLDFLQACLANVQPLRRSSADLQLHEGGSQEGWKRSRRHAGLQVLQ